MLPFIKPRPRERTLTMSESESVLPLDRRGFLKVGAAIGGGLVLNLALPLVLKSTWAAAAAGSSNFAPNAFIRIDRTGAVTSRVRAVAPA